MTNQPNDEIKAKDSEDVVNILDDYVDLKIRQKHTYLTILGSNGLKDAEKYFNLFEIEIEKVRFLLRKYFNNNNK